MLVDKLLLEGELLKLEDEPISEDWLLPAEGQLSDDVYWPPEELQLDVELSLGGEPLPGADALPLSEGDAWPLPGSAGST